MKRALIILPLLAVMAGVASAQVQQPPARAEASPTRMAPTVVARQAPVPMLLTSRSPALAPTAAGADSGPTETTSRHLSEASARSAIEADGYRMPQMVAKGADGAWRARALRGTVEVSLRVDAQGNVTGE